MLSEIGLQFESSSRESLDEVPLTSPKASMDIDDDDSEEEWRHDQLPSLEEYRSNLRNLHRQDNGIMVRRYSPLVRMAGVSALVLLVLGATLAATRYQRNFLPASKQSRASSFLEKKGISNSSDLRDPDSPQAKALEWVLADDDSVDWDKESEPFIQRYIVTLFLISLAPKDNFPVEFWKPMEHECTWNAEYEKESGTRISVGFLCNDNRQVTDIVFPTFGLKGVLPSELTKLSHLKRLGLEVNKISGIVPLIPSLETLSIKYNRFSGSLPEELGAMSLLEFVDISENGLQGSLPFGMTRLTKLTTLALEGNQITGGLESISTLDNLRELYMSNNALDQTLQEETIQSLTNLRVLDINHNYLSGSIPDTLWGMTNIEVIDMSHNYFSDKIGETLLPHAIEYLDISHNLLTGGLPATSLQYWTKLTHLDASSNRFDEMLPVQMTSLTHMETLILADNAQFGPHVFPEWIEHMTRLSHLDMSLTGRTGPLPEWITDLTNLRTLNLYWNHLDGQISPEWNQLTKLEYLLLNRNWFSGNFPDLSELSHLKLLLLDQNKFEGQVEACSTHYAVADCGNPSEGCPNCESDTQQVSCPCCQECCWEGNEDTCNRRDWMERIPPSWQDEYERDTYHYSPDTKLLPISNGDGS